MFSATADFFAQLAIMLPAFLASLSFHEFFHALVAYLCGDDTAKRAGRLTLNPLAHVDFLGLLCLLFFRIGWAKSVPFDERNFKRPKLYSILTALAGPLANFLFALILFYIITYFPKHLFQPYVSLTFLQIFSITAYVNVMLGVFNLLPIPPLDGSHVLTVFLIDRYPNFVFGRNIISVVSPVALFMLAHKIYLAAVYAVAYVATMGGCIGAFIFLCNKVYAKLCPEFLTETISWARRNARDFSGAI